MCCTGKEFVCLNRQGCQELPESCNGKHYVDDDALDELSVFWVLLFLNSHEISYVVFRSRMWYTVPQLQKCHTLQEPPIFSTHLEVMLSLCMSSLSLSLSSGC